MVREIGLTQVTQLAVVAQPREIWVYTAPCTSPRFENMGLAIRRNLHKLVGWNEEGIVLTVSNSSHTFIRCPILRLKRMIPGDSIYAGASDPTGRGSTQDLSAGAHSAQQIH